MWALRRSASGAPILLLSLPLLGVARLLPAHGFGLWLRLVAASLVAVVAGGARRTRTAAARRFGDRGVGARRARARARCSSSSCTARSCWRSLCSASSARRAAVRAACRLGAARVGHAGDRVSRARVRVALWHVAGVVTGDALFHLGRVQKLYRSATCTSVRWTSSRTAASTPAMPFRSGMLSSRSSQRSAESVRRR